MDINEVMSKLEEIYGREMLEPFDGKERWEAYHTAYGKTQEVAKAMSDDDHLSESETTAHMVLYQTIMRAWEKELKNEAYNFPPFPEFAKDEEPYTVSGRVETWSTIM